MDEMKLHEKTIEDLDKLEITKGGMNEWHKDIDKNFWSDGTVIREKDIREWMISKVKELIKCDTDGFTRSGKKCSRLSSDLYCEKHGSLTYRNQTIALALMDLFDITSRDLK